jgi:hypothetical protein
LIIARSARSFGRTFGMNGWPHPGDERVPLHRVPRSLSNALRARHQRIFEFAARVKRVLQVIVDLPRRGGRLFRFFGR